MGLAVVVLLTGCGVPSRDVLRTKPDESLTREAYLDTPVIADDRGREIELRTTRNEVFRLLGRSRVAYPRLGLSCVLYPINGTARRDEFGSPAADEWEFCFDDSDRVRTRLRVSTVS